MSSATVAPPPVVCPQPVENAALRVFVLHHAAGSHLMYRPLQPHFPADWEVCFLDAPGRGLLSHMPAHGDSVQLADFLIDGIEPLLREGKFAVFGHSMGALVGFDLACRLTERGLPEPVWLGMSSCSDYNPVADADETRLHLLAGEELRKALAQMGAIPATVLGRDDIWQVLEPRFRRDFRLVETWQPRPGAAVTRTPLSVFGGSDDPMAPTDRRSGWTRHAEHIVGEHTFAGGHFYFQEQEGPLVEQVVADIRSALALSAHRAVPTM